MIANPKWSFAVPDGWYANTQPAGSRRSSCVVLQPRVPAANLHDGFFWLGEDEVDIGIYGIVVKDYSGSIDEMLTGAAANSGVRTSVRVTAAGVVSEAPTPNASFELLMEAANPNRLQMVRFRVVIAEDIGNLHKGDVDQGLLVTAPFGGVVRVARGGQTDVGEAEIAAALDQIAPTFVLK